MIQSRMIHYFQNRAAGACLGIGCGVDEATEAGVENGSGAHGARFERDDERASGESVVVQVVRGVAHGDDFGVGRGIVVADDAVVASADDFAIKKNDGSYGHFAFCFCGVRFGDGFVHGFDIGHGLQLFSQSNRNAKAKCKSAASIYLCCEAAIFGEEDGIRAF